MSQFLITQQLFNDMNFDTNTNKLNSNKQLTTEIAGKKVSIKPSALVVFAHSDINAAIYHLIKSLDSPFDPQAVATVLVQEAVKKYFIEKLLQQYELYNFNKLESNDEFNKTVETAKKLNAHFIIPHISEENPYQHCIIGDFTHEQLGSKLSAGIVTLHTFRTAKEAINLINSESTQFTNISIWQENHGHAYELVLKIKTKNFFINCHLSPLVVLEESISQERNYVMIDKCYHYERIQFDGIQKSVVFPIGSIFAN